MTENYLLFQLAGRVFGVQLSSAKEIFPWRKPRAVPLSNTFVDGLIEFRGTVYPVFDLERRLGLKRSSPPSDEKGKSIVLIEKKEGLFGISVDSVLKMTPLDLEGGHPKKTPGIDPSHLKAVIKQDEQDLIILDFERLFHAG